MEAMSQKKGSQQHYESAYKSIESQDDTRNPTTNKKIHGTPIQFKRSNPYTSSRYLQSRVPRFASHSHSIEEELKFMETKKLLYMREGKIKKAQRIAERMAGAKSLKNQIEFKRIIRSQKKQKRSVTVAHNNEMQHLHRLWNQYFGNLRQREIEILQSFKEVQKLQIQSAREKLQRRCLSLRSYSRDKLDLQKKEDYYMKVCDFKGLSHVRKELKKISERQRSERQNVMNRWAELEEQKLSVSQSRKYSTLMSRLQEYRQDKQKIYMREQKRLKQKYKNVLVQLQHEQTMQICNVSRIITFDN